MAIPSTTKDLENAKFGESSVFPNRTVVRTQDDSITGVLQQLLIELGTFDTVGSSKAYNGEALQNVITLVPPIEGKVINSFGIFTDDKENMSVSLDDGDTFLQIDNNSFFSWNIKGGIKQIQLTADKDAGYRMIINFEP